MIPAWQEIASAITRAIDASQIGRPRSARITIHLISDSPDHQEALKTDVMASLERWFGGPPNPPQTAECKPDQPILITWANGASAIVSVTSSTAGKPGGDVTILGSEGSIFHRLSGVES